MKGLEGRALEDLADEHASIGQVIDFIGENSSDAETIFQLRRVQRDIADVALDEYGAQLER